MALVAVLWAVVLLTLIAAMVLNISRTHSRVARRFADMARAETAADSAINLTLLRIGTRTPGQFAAQMSPAIGNTPTFTQGIAVSIQRESERVDLNAAGADTLGVCFLGAGFPEDTARSMAARVIDWRDADDIAEPGGAEEADYRAAGLRYGPRNGPFQTVEELRRVLGMGILSDSVLNLFTVYTHEADEDLTAGVSEDGTVTGSKPHCGGPRGTRVSAPGLAAQDDLIGQVVRVHACSSDRVQVCRLVVVRLTGSVQAPFQIFVWKTEDPSS
jgi:general secretion pathway protein K